MLPNRSLVGIKQSFVLSVAFQTVHNVGVVANVPSCNSKQCAAKQSLTAHIPLIGNLTFTDDSLCHVTISQLLRPSGMAARAWTLSEHLLGTFAVMTYTEVSSIR